MEQDTSQPLEAPLDTGRGLHGVLRYKRELQERRTNVQPQALKDPACCEFCGSEVKPLLGHPQESEEFCCVQYRELFEEMDKERRLILGLTDVLPGLPTQSEDAHDSTENQHNKGVMEWNSEFLRLQQKEMERFYKEAASKLSAENSLIQTKTIRFQLSSWSLDECWITKHDCSGDEKVNHKEWYKHIGSDPAGFGLSHQQDHAEFIKKFYSNGKKFLTGFPDGSAQVFYPSGNLAIIVITHQASRVCMVHDDVTPQSPIRAVFQSNGRATCYHGNGNVWLNMDMWGGRSLDEGGARTRRWSWSDHAQTHTPLRPIFLSLNKNVGVRILGRQCVFVSFLAMGQQIRFSVGSCIQPKDHDTRPPEPPLCKEELLLLVFRLHLRLTLARSRWCLRFPSSSGPRHARAPSGLRSLAQRLLSMSASVQMEDADREFVRHCLQDCQ